MRRLAVVAAAFLAVVRGACSSGASTPAPAETRAQEAVAEDQAPASAPTAAAQEAPGAVKKDPSRKVVVLDPGHGGDEIGASAHGVVEKESNLDMALRVERLLVAQGFEVVLTRRSDARAAASIPGYTATRADLQTRLDAANAAGGDVFISIHSNGSTDAGQRGVEAWYDSSRGAFAQESFLLAGMLVDSVLAELRGAGYAVQDRGLFDGKCFRLREGRCFTLFVVAGPRETTREDVIRRGGDPAALGFGDRDAMFSRPANMPAALLELLLITNPQDAAILRNEAARDAMARGVTSAIAEFLNATARSN